MEFLFTVDRPQVQTLDRVAAELPMYQLRAHTPDMQPYQSGAHNMPVLSLSADNIAKENANLTRS